MQPIHGKGHAPMATKQETADLASRLINAGISSALIDAALTAQERAYFDRQRAKEEADDRLSGLPQIAQVANVHITTVRRWIRSGEIPAKKIAGGKYIASKRKVIAALGL